MQITPACHVLENTVKMRFPEIFDCALAEYIQNATSMLH